MFVKHYLYQNTVCVAVYSLVIFSEKQFISELGDNVKTGVNNTCRQLGSLVSRLFTMEEDSVSQNKELANE